METKDVLLKIRKNHNLSQEDMANRLHVTRQAVSRWECGETSPNNETLKEISKQFNVSVNTLLGAPEQKICQCCGMPLSDEIMGHENDGMINEDYCKWCYQDGHNVYNSMDELIEKCVPLLVQQGFSEEQAKIYMKNSLPTLKYWKNKCAN